MLICCRRQCGNYPITPSGVTAVNYDITFVPGTLTVEKVAASVIVTAPTAKTNLVADGTEHELVNAGEAIGGEMQYKVNHGEWSPSIPVATEVGPYVVFYKVVGDQNHNDDPGSFVVVAIEKAAGAITVTYKAEDGEVLFSEKVDLHFPEVPILSGKTFIGWTVDYVDEDDVVLRTVYISDNPTGAPSSQANQAPTKIFKNGHVYVLRGGKTYTVQGQEVK